MTKTKVDVAKVLDSRLVVAKREVVSSRVVDAGALVVVSCECLVITKVLGGRVTTVLTVVASVVVIVSVRDEPDVVKEFLVVLTFSVEERVNSSVLVDLDDV